MRSDLAGRIRENGKDGEVEDILGYGQVDGALMAHLEMNSVQDHSDVSAVDTHKDGKASPPLTSRENHEQLSSLSHFGTIAQRCRGFPSPTAPLQRTNLELEPVEFGADPVRLQPDPQHCLMSRPPLEGVVHVEVEPKESGHSTWNPPKGPRDFLRKLDLPRPASNEHIVCFDSNHHGICGLKHGLGRGTPCAYSHFIPSSHAVVGEPANSTKHDQECSLPLCPVHLQAKSRLLENHEGLQNETGPMMKFEPKDARLRNYLSDDENSHSMEEDTRSYDQAMQHEPDQMLVQQRTSAELVKDHTRDRLEVEQAENELRRKRKKYLTELKRLEENLKRKKKMRLYHDVMPRAQDERICPPACSAVATVSGVGPDESNLTAIAPARGLCHTDIANENSTAISQPEANLHREGTNPISTVPDLPTAPDLQRKETSQNRADISTTGKAVEQESDEPAENVYKAFVDYQLPVGEDRMDWDTDSVRRSFGEIE